MMKNWQFSLKSTFCKNVLELCSVKHFWSSKNGWIEAILKNGRTFALDAFMPKLQRKSWIVSIRDSTRHSSKDVHSICIPIHNKPNSDTDCYCCHLSYHSQWGQIINKIAFKSINYEISQDFMSGFWIPKF